ncbi:MAG TPA: nucleotidyltransferase domain-containing protein [Bacteroidota bacterium]|nr:nucleotidyltransferase domain-containing protein [Bacteroidota bacterium]
MDKKTREAITIAKRYIEVLKTHKIKVERAYLYGSYARGGPHKDSDIDIVVVSRQFRKSRFEDSLRIAKLRRDVDLRISPLAYHPRNFIMDYIIPNEAMTKGIRIA